MADKPGAAAGFAAYHAATRDGAPRETLLRALAGFDAEPALKPSVATPRFALDLGCGTGRDALELLRRGWRVLAIDADVDAIAELHARAGPAVAQDRLETRVAQFETLDLARCDLVNSSFALTLCPPEAFPGLWRRVRDALRPGGRISCQLFGPRDSWAGRVPPIAIHDHAAVAAMLDGMAVEFLREEETDSVTPRGQSKHWHIFHLVARKV